MFDEQEYFTYKAAYEQMFAGLGMVRDKMKSEEEQNAFDNALDDWLEAQYN